MDSEEAKLERNRNIAIIGLAVLIFVAGIAKFGFGWF